MATSGKGLGIAFLINLCILLIIAVLFSIWRFLKLTRKFYQPKRVSPPPGRSRPPKLRRRFGLWFPQILHMSEDDMLRCAGVDAVMYIKVLRMGWELMLMVGILCLVIIMPINITSGNVDDLMGAAYDPDSVSKYMYWISPPAPPAPPAPGAPPSPPQERAQPSTIEAPEIYNKSIPEAPPGLTWWQYLPGVPPLPDPATELGPEYAGYQWKYDDSYTVQEYYFTDLDKTTMTNVPEGSDRLWAHCIMTWVVTVLSMWHFWRYCKVALRLRMLHLLTAPPGVETHTVLCTDVPGIPHGTIPDRLDGTVLKLVPRSVKDKAFEQVHRLKASPSSIMLGGDAVEASAIDGAPGNSQEFTDVELGEKTPLAEGTSTASASPAAATVGGSGASSPAVQDGVQIFNGNNQQQRQQQDQQFGASWRMPDRWGEACDEINRGKSAPTMVDGTFRKIYHNDISHVHMVFDTSKLDPLMATYLSVKEKAANAVDVAVSKFRRGKKMKPQKSLVIGPRYGHWGMSKYGKKPQKVDSFQHYADHLDHLHGALLAEQATAKRHARPAAFVTFKTRKAQVVSSGSLMSEDLTTWRCQAAPRPDEIVWHNLGLRGWERSGRSILMWICFFLLCLFFMIPVTAVQAILTTNSLVSFIQDIPILNSVITGILPALALNIFLAILPMILRSMQKVSGRVSESQVDLGVVTWFFIFQVITVFFGSFVAGTFANQFEQLINDPGSIVQILGTAAPQAGIFFVTFLLVRGMLGVPQSLLRVVPFIIYYIRAKIAATKRAKQRLWFSPPIRYGTQIPGDTIAILLGLTFCCICPLITPAALIYFSTSYIARKHNLAYVYSESYQAGGVLWLRVFDQCICGMIIFQLVMICLLGIKEVVAPPLVLIPLPFITLAYAYAAHATFWPPMGTLSMMTAGDRDTREALVGKDLAEGVADAYVSPSFHIDEEEHDELVRQCLLVQKAQESGDYTSLESLYDMQDAALVDDSDLDEEVASSFDKGLRSPPPTPNVSVEALGKDAAKKA